MFLHWTKTYLLLIAISLLFFAADAFAATLYFEPVERHLGIGAEFSLSLLLDPDGEQVNALEGVILYPEDLLELVRISDGGSVVNLWLRPPSPSGKGIATFSGIIPGGFEGTHEPFQKETKAGRVVELVFRAKAAGEGEVMLADAAVLLNDGYGTPAEVSLVPFVFETASFQSRERLFEKDIEPPEFFTPQIENDPRLFDGKFYLIFSTQDTGSGIAGYEVCETTREDISGGCIARWRKAESPKVLQDQSLGSRVLVKAIDHAGNERIAELSPVGAETGKRGGGLLSTLFLIVLAIAILARRKFSGRKAHRDNRRR